MAKNLLNSLEILGLAGILLTGIFGKASSHEPDESNFAKFGARNYSSTSITGAKTDINGLYLQIGKKLEDLEFYAEAGVFNPVINNGFENPNSKEKIDVSPNTFIGGVSVGGRYRFFESENEEISLNGELKLSKISEFDDFAKWNEGYSLIHIDGITSIDAGLFAEKKYQSFGFIVGANINSSYCSGEVLTSDNSASDVYSEFNQRNKAEIKGVVGINYTLDNNCNLECNARIGDSISIDIGLLKRW